MISSATPACDVGRVGRRQAEHDVAEAGVNRPGDDVACGGGSVVADGQGDRAGDRPRAAVDRRAVAVEQGTASGGVVDVSSGIVPQVRVFGDDARGRGGAAAHPDVGAG